MPRIHPFTGLLYDPSVVGSLAGVTAPPYDMVSEETMRRNLASGPHHVSRLELSRTGGDDAQYTEAARALEEWRCSGALRSTAGPRLFPYEMSFTLRGARRRLRGLIAAVEIESWGGGILPHERTMPGPVDDRHLLLRATRANISSIELIAPGPVPALTAIFDTLGDHPPVAEAVDEEGVHHRLWEVEDDLGASSQLADQVCMIADGHHRYTTALRYRDEMRARSGAGPWDQVMALVVDAETERPPVLPYHRVLTGGPVPSPDLRVRDLQEVLEAIDDEAGTCGLVARGPDGIVHGVSKLEGGAPVVRSLDALLPPMEHRTFVHDAVEAEDAVRHGAATHAWILPPTSAQRIRAIVDTGDRLPEKATFFWPKPRTGLVMRPLT